MEVVENLAIPNHLIYILVLLDPIFHPSNIPLFHVGPGLDAEEVLGIGGGDFFCFSKVHAFETTEFF